MAQEPNIRISQCMIVKNEEKNIRQALSWGKDIVCEQIVVDTGSTDRTVEVAEAMGAKVLCYEWTEDFSAAKNYAIEQAQGDWIAFLDADEYLNEESAAKLSHLLKQVQESGCFALVMELLNLDDSGKVFSSINHVRFFRNLPNLRYQGRIHEDLTMNGESLRKGQFLCAGDGVCIYHTGYSASATQGGVKARRNRFLIEKELEEHPHDGDLMGYLADCYRAENENEKAIQWYEKAIIAICDNRTGSGTHLTRIFSYLMFLLAVEKKETRLMEIYHMASERMPKESDYDYIVGKYFACKGDYEKGALHLERALKLLDECEDDFSGAFFTGDMPKALELLALCCLHRGNIEKCILCCVDILKTDRYYMIALVIMLSALKKDEELNKQPLSAEAAVSLGKLYDLNSLKDRFFVLRSAVEAGYEGMIKIIRGTLSQEELAAYDQAMRK